MNTFNRNFQHMVQRTWAKTVAAGKRRWSRWYPLLDRSVPVRGARARQVCRQPPRRRRTACSRRTDADGRICSTLRSLAQRAAFLRDRLAGRDHHAERRERLLDRRWAIKPGWSRSTSKTSAPMFRGSSRCATDPNDQVLLLRVRSAARGLPGRSGVPGRTPRTTSEPPARRSGRAEPALLRAEASLRLGLPVPDAALRQRAHAAASVLERARSVQVEGCDAAGHRAHNPLFAGGRVPSEVFLGGYRRRAVASHRRRARTPTGARSTRPNVLRFKSYGELTADGAGTRSWAHRRAVAGCAGSEPEVAGSPGTLPTTAADGREPAIPAAGSHWWATRSTGGTIDTTQGPGQARRVRTDDLQYACIFPLADPRNCATARSRTTTPATATRTAEPSRSASNSRA